MLLSPAEKEIARAVTLTFGQRVCGFDLLRTERGRSYVCDVNGWSFVKNSHKVGAVGWLGGGWVEIDELIINWNFAINNSSI